MLRFRFTNFQLMLATFLFCLLVSAATTVGLPMLAFVWAMLVRVSLFASILGALFPQNASRRAFWIGYTVFGWGGYFLTQNSLNIEQFGHWLDGFFLLSFASVGGILAIVLEKNSLLERSHE